MTLFSQNEANLFLLLLRRLSMLVRGEGVGGVGDRLVSFSSSRWQPLSVLECLMKGCLDTLGLCDMALEEDGSRAGLAQRGGLYGHSKLSLFATLVLSFRSRSWSNNLDCSV